MNEEKNGVLSREDVDRVIKLAFEEWLKKQEQKERKNTNISSEIDGFEKDDDNKLKILEESFFKANGMPAINRELETLFGKEVIKNAKEGRVTELKELIEKNGKDYNKFVSMIEEFSKLEPAKKARKNLTEQDLEMLREKYRGIGNVLEEIKEKRINKNPNVKFPESVWKKYYVKGFKGNKEDLIENKNEQEKTTLLKREEFLNSIRVNEEDLIVQNDIKSEQIQMKALEKDDDELVL